MRVYRSIVAELSVRPWAISSIATTKNQENERNSQQKQNKNDDRDRELCFV